MFNSLKETLCGCFKTGLPSNGQGDGANKRIQLQFAPTVQAPQQATEEDEGTLIINTSDTQQVGLMV